MYTLRPAEFEARLQLAPSVDFATRIYWVDRTVWQSAGQSARQSAIQSAGPNAGQYAEWNQSE